MKCIICRIGDTEPVCGEAYTDEDVTDRLLHLLEEEAQKGPREEFIQYVA